MNIARRHVLLSGALVAAVSATAWVTYASSDAEAAIATPVSGNASLPSVRVDRKDDVKALQPLNPDSLRRPAMTAGEENPFNSKSWYAPPPVIASAPPAPPPVPSAPPMPFTYIGKMVEDDRLLVYLAKGEQMFTVAKGETFDEVYRFDGLENGNLVIQYLPLAAKQLIAVGTES